MWYLRALAVAVVVVPLVVGTGCVTKQTYDRDIQVERDKTIKAMRELDQAKSDLKKANDTASPSLTQKATDLASVRATRRRAETRGRPPGLDQDPGGEGEEGAGTRR